LLSKYPHVQQGSKTFAILQVTVSAERTVLDAVAGKLKVEGWSSNLQRRRDGTVALGVGLEKRTLPQALKLLDRLNAGEFGEVKAEPLALPDPVR